jgi:hypothetical protein
MNAQLWQFVDMSTGETRFVQAGSQKSASDKLKAREIKFTALKKYRRTK